MATPVRQSVASDGDSGRPRAVEFLSAAAGPAGHQLAASVTLRDFRDTPGRLTLEDRRLLVEQAIILLEQNYVHLPLKIAMHGVNPVQRLRVLAIRLERQTEQTLDPEPAFNAMLSETFHSVRDLHTNYLLPRPYAGKIAYLPFRVEEFYDTPDAPPRYVVTSVAEGFVADSFGPGTEITHWGGVRIRRAVETNAARFAGSNAAARRARGVESLTIRPLLLHLPPDEDWVTVTYRDPGGGEREVRVDWLVVDNLPPSLDDDPAHAALLAVDAETDAASRAKTLLFAPHVLDDQGQETAASTDEAEVPTLMRDVFRARRVNTTSGEFGHIRIFKFSVPDPHAFVDEFVRLIRALPQRGLIVDVRDNGGGHVHASELTLQTLTPHRISPEPAQFIGSPVNLRICRGNRGPAALVDLAPWAPSLDEARETGSTFSGATALTPEGDANAIGQQYHGPVVLVTNARCYSATDIFAAGFADHRIGPIIGTDETTGAGGANVWTHTLLHRLHDAAGPPSPYRPLPHGAGMRVAIRRTLRVGERSGTPLEDLGVAPTRMHRMSRRDVLEGNSDLLDVAGGLLAAMPVRSLDVDAVATNDKLRVRIAAENVEWATVQIDGRPRLSLEVGGVTITEIDGVAGARVVRVDGFDGETLVASRTVRITAEPMVDGRAPRRSDTEATARTGGELLVVYVHGAGNQPPAAELKRSWDRDLFGRDIGDRSVMAHYADLLHPAPALLGEDPVSVADAIDVLRAGEVVDPSGAVLMAEAGDLLGELTPQGRSLALSLSISMLARSMDTPARLDPAEALGGVLPLPREIRTALLRALLRRLIPDADAYFFGGQNDAIRARLRRVLDTHSGPLVVVSHSLGTVVAYDVLSEARFAGREITALFTMGSPLGYQEIQDVVTAPLSVPAPVRQWVNVADPFDVVTLDTGLADDFGGGPIVDVLVDNPSASNHAASGYLATREMRSRVGLIVPQ